MCIVIDTNVLGPVFNKDNIYHASYEPVLDWIYNGQGKVVYGGTKYFSEIKRYTKLFLLLKKTNKAVYIDSQKVDQLTQYASEAIVHKDFDDQHLVGLLLASGCKLLCTNDIRALQFVKNRVFFKSTNEPKIYNSKRNIKLLTPRYIAPCCGQCRPTTNEQKNIMNTGLNSLILAN